MSDTDRRIEIVIYKCRECGHRITIYEREAQAIFCQCSEEGPAMLPIDTDREC